MRAAAFTLFGSLSRFGNGPSEGPFLEQIQTNFVTLLLHLDEADPVVIAVRCHGYTLLLLKYSETCVSGLVPVPVYTVWE